MECFPTARTIVGTTDRAAFVVAVEDFRTLIRRAELPVVGPSGRAARLSALGMFGYNFSTGRLVAVSGSLAMG